MLQYTTRRRAGIVDQNVDSAESCVGRPDEGLDVYRLSEIGNDRNNPAARFLDDFGSGLLQRPLAPRADRDVGTLVRECTRDRSADSFTGAGDNRLFVSQP